MDKRDAWIRRRYWVRITPNLGFGPIVVPEYSGLFVRRLLLECSRTAVLAVNKASGARPFAVSPLYRVVDDGKVEALYPRFNGGMANYPVIHEDDILFFEVGSAPGYGDMHDELVECLKGGHVVEYGEQYVEVRLARHMDIVAYEGLDGSPAYTLEPGVKIRIIFASPAQPVSIARPGSTWRVLLPAPFYIFSLNALEMHGNSLSAAISALLRVDEILSPAPTALKTSSVTTFILRGRQREPGLIGYVNLYVLEGPRESIEEAMHLLSHAAVMGVGASRAIGLGSVWVRIEH